MTTGTGAFVDELTGGLDFELFRMDVVCDREIEGIADALL